MAQRTDSFSPEKDTKRERVDRWGKLQHKLAQAITLVLCFSFITSDCVILWYRLKIFHLHSSHVHISCSRSELHTSDRGLPTERQGILQTSAVNAPSWLPLIVSTICDTEYTDSTEHDYHDYPYSLKRGWDGAVFRSVYSTTPHTGSVSHCTARNRD